MLLGGGVQLFSGPELLPERATCSLGTINADISGGWRWLHLSSAGGQGHRGWEGNSLCEYGIQSAQYKAMRPC